MTTINFFAKVCNEMDFATYKVQKEKQSRKGQAELTAQKKYFKSNQRRLIKMATREENLKKINTELEKMSDEQLEQVAVPPLTCLTTSPARTSNGIASKITSLWNKAGIQVKYNDFGANSYSINGQPISRNDAVDKLANNLGYHDMDTSKFKI